MNKTQNNIFTPLLFLTIFFILLQISFFIQSNQFIFNLKKLSFSYFIPAIIKPLIYYICAQSFLHLAFLVFVWIAIRSLIIHKLFSRLASLKLAIIVWFICIFGVLSANQYYFPYSKFAALTTFFIPHSINNLLFILFTLFYTLILLNIFYLIINRYFKKLVFATIFFTLGVLGLFYQFNKFDFLEPSLNQPNIILIGIDSLRPDFTHFFGGLATTKTIDQFLTEATVFSDAFTPLARTFPAWMSLLTGKYPLQNGFRTNLASQEGKNFSDTLPTLLKKAGYHTIYASDETRFSNISKPMGFDQIITPPMGVADFLLGSINDFPLANLVMNTVLGAWLFPYSYGNRAAFFNYEPRSFLQKIKNSLTLSKKQPLFLSIHFCLPHYPYLWASTPLSFKTIKERYVASIQGVDQQVNDFLHLLNKENLLKNAIVVLFSDHGEALGLENDRVTQAELFSPGKLPKDPFPNFLDNKMIAQTVMRSAGHGTDILSLSQYHILLAIKLYNNQLQQKKIIPGLVSLLDIKPTLLSLLNLDCLGQKKTLQRQCYQYSGQSLTPYLFQSRKLISAPYFFMETDFTPHAIRSVYPNMEQALLEGINLFSANEKTGLLVVKPQFLEIINQTKQYAVISGKWLLALYPQSPLIAGQQTFLPVLVDLETGKWTWNLSNLHQPIAQTLLSALQNFYKIEIILA